MKRNNEDFKMFLNGMGLKYESLSPEDITYWENTYEDAIKKSEEIYNKTMDFLDSDFRNVNFLEYMKNNKNALMHSAVINKHDEKIMEKFNRFAERHEMQMSYEIVHDNKQFQKDGFLIVENWESPYGFKMKIPMIVNPDTFPKIDIKTQLQIISAMLDRNEHIYEYQINCLSLKNKIKYYTELMNAAVEKEDYETAISYRDTIKDLK